MPWQSDGDAHGRTVEDCEASWAANVRFWPDEKRRGSQASATTSSRLPSLRQTLRATVASIAPSRTSSFPHDASRPSSAAPRPSNAVARTESSGSRPSAQAKKRETQTRRTIHDNTKLRQSVRQQLALERQQEETEKLLKIARLSRCTLACRYTVESKVFVALTTLLTCYALVGDDFRLIATNQPADMYFNILALACIVIFFFEIVLSCQGKEDYFLGFFFFLDTVSTITLVLDLTWVNEGLLQSDEEDMDNMKGGKTARIGARAARIVRVLRLVRILKLYKAVYEARAAQIRAEKRKRKEKRQGVDNRDWGADDEDFDDTDLLLAESQVGKRLSELTTRRVIILVLAMMLGLPFFSIDKAAQLPTATTYGVELVSQAFRRFERNVSKQEAYELALLQYVYFHNWFSLECSDRLCPADYYSNIFWFGIGGRQSDEVISKAHQGRVRHSTVATWTKTILHQDSQFMMGSMPKVAEAMLSSPWNATCRTSKGILRQGISLLRKKIEGFNTYAVECPEDLRTVERTKYSERLRKQDEYKDWHFCIYVDNRSYVKAESIMNMMVTAFICMVLMAASIYISSDSQALVLRPVESMILKVHMIRINPLMAMRLADDAFRQEEIQKAKAVAKQKTRWQQFRQVVLCLPAQEVKDNPMETIILEKTIIKLGTLLALGFGEAGANIIGHNMSSGDSSNVDAMVPGSMVECIIGSARIRDFGVATEVLQKRVMTFVNQVAEIVHGVVDSCHGSPNRNNGDTFLAIWPTIDLEPELVAKLADMSMLALVRIFAAVHRSPVLATYRGHPGLQQRFGELTRVSLTFGLHYGWAIEGAVGSEFKIDASYLSPNVTVAETVERATEVYGVAILVTSAVLGLCTPEMAAKCRLIDCVWAPGYLKPLEIFVIDLNCFFLEIEVNRHFRWNSRQRFRSRQFLEGEKKKKLQAECIVVEQFDTDLDINTMRAPYTLEFMQIFNMGYQNYSQGEWEVAGRILWNTRTMLGFEDGPSSALLRYMQETSEFQCPEGWKGIHHLEETGRMGPLAYPAGGRKSSCEAHATPLAVQIELGDASDKAASQELSHKKAALDVMQENPLPPEPPPPGADAAADEVRDDVPVEEPALLNQRLLNSK